MKNFWLLILLVLINCKKQNVNENIKTELEKIPEIKYGKNFFDYDQIDYYQIDFKENQITELDSNKEKSKIDMLKYKLIIDETPTNINDLEFLNYMNKIGYSKKEIDTSKFKQMDKVFIEKTESTGYTAACIPVFRDILIFKKRRKVVGIVKICFECHQYRIIGTNANIDNFGSDSDYDQLGRILEQN